VKKLGPPVLLGLLLWIAAPASAKGPALTWEFRPGQPVAGEATMVVLQTWDWTPDGQPDLADPWPHARLGVANWDIHLYPAHAFPQRGPNRIERPLGPWERTGPARYETTISIPRRGAWVLAQRDPYSHYYPDWLNAEVHVLPRGSRDGAGAIPNIQRGRLDQERPLDARPIAAGVAVGALLVIEALLQRRRREEP